MAKTFLHTALASIRSCSCTRWLFFFFFFFNSLRDYSLLYLIIFRMFKNQHFYQKLKNEIFDKNTTLLLTIK